MGILVEPQAKIRCHHCGREFCACQAHPLRIAPEGDSILLCCPTCNSIVATATVSVYELRGAGQLAPTPQIELSVSGVAASVSA